MRIRHYTPSDFRNVVNIFQRAVHQGCATSCTAAQRATWAPEPPDLMRWTIELTHGLVWVCDDAAGQPIGFLQIGRDGLVRHLYVDPPFERVGVASRLLQTAMNWAREERLDTLRAWAFDVSRSFFERHGFQPDDAARIVDPHAGGLRRKPMHKPLLTIESAR